MSKVVSKFFTPYSPKPVEAKLPKIRASITPGTVLIIVAGRFAGKRVIFLKSLASGLLLVTGPFKVNHVPLRRISQKYVIATSTKVDISAVKVPAAVDDVYFRKEVKEPTEEQKANQEAVDTALMPCIKKVPMLEEYLKARFYLNKNKRPHDMKF